jgi:hypothetical protein
MFLLIQNGSQANPSSTQLLYNPISRLFLICRYDAPDIAA